MKKLLLPIALLLTNTAFAANWVKVGETPVGKFTSYVDTHSIKKINSKDKQQVRYFVKTDYQQTQKTADGKSYDYEVIQWKADCDEEKYLFLAATYYTRDGKVVSSFTYNSDEWRPVYPESIAASELGYACEFMGY